MGILSVLSSISQSLGDAALEAKVGALLEHCLGRPTKRCGVADAPLCHGAMGNAHVFNRLFHFTGNRRCRDAALNWLGHALSMRQASGGVGGFFQLTRPDPSQPAVLEPSFAFLDGSTGIALSLLSFVSPIPPTWDRLLLLSGAELS
jgi:hypothetical protein